MSSNERHFSASAQGPASTPPGVSPADMPCPPSPGHVYGGAYYYGAPIGEHSRGVDPLNPARLLHIFRKRWLTVGLVFLFVLTAAVYYLSKTPRIYASTALIEISTRRPRILDRHDAVIDDTSSRKSEETLNTQIVKFNSRTIIPYAIASYREQFPGESISDDELAYRFRDGACFRLQQNTRLVEVTFEDGDPEFAVKACAAHAAAAEAKVRAENRSVSDAAVVWLQEQAELQRQALDDAEKALLVAHRQYKLDMLRGRRKAARSTIERFTDLLIDVEGKAALEENLLAKLESVALEPDSIGEFPSDISRADEVDEALQRWLAAIAEREDLLSRYTAQHPSVMVKDQAVTRYREQVRDALQRVRLTTAANLALYRDQAENLRRRKDQELRNASNLENEILNSEKQVAALTRIRSTADASYQGVLNRIEEARLSADENTATVKPVEGARHAKQIAPRTVRILMMALMLGLGGGMGLAVLIENLDDRIFVAHDIESSASIKTLAVIPHARASQRRDVAMASYTRRYGMVAEAYAGLRSVLDAPIHREQSRVVLSASSLPAEGKTTTCCNLATAFARNGQKTLLIDFDLRRPRLARIFSMPPRQTGLLEYLADPTADDPACLAFETECPNLSLIASRYIKEASPAELIGSRKALDIIDWARNHYDRIILDAPPLGLVSDALALAGMADYVLVMARPKTSRRRALRHTVQRLHDVGVSMIGGVLNDVDLTKYSGHGYGSYPFYQKHYENYIQQDETGS